MQLLDLKELCEEVLEKSEIRESQVVNGQSLKNGEWVNNYEDGRIIINPEIAEGLLPTTSGFFFGSTDYDEWYIQDLEYTIKIISKVLEEVNFDENYIVYSSSW